MRYRIIILSLMLWTLLLVSCRPRGVLSSRQMRDVLYDLHRAEAIIQVAELTYGNSETIAKYYQVALDKHHVTQAQLDSSLVWYTDHPQRFNKIYPKIVARCVLEEQELAPIVSQLVEELPLVTRELLPMEDVMYTTLYGFPITLVPPIPIDSNRLVLPLFEPKMEEK